MKFKKLALFFIIFTSYYIQIETRTPPVKDTDYPDISCGKENPVKETDCTKYGTDSGMLSCWVSEKKDSKEGKCTLLSENRAKEMEIYPTNTFDNNEYWSCGNKSFYISINILLFFISLLLLY